MFYRLLTYKKKTDFFLHVIISIPGSLQWLFLLWRCHFNASRPPVVTQSPVSGKRRCSPGNARNHCQRFKPYRSSLGQEEKVKYRARGKKRVSSETMVALKHLLFARLKRKTRTTESRDARKGDYYVVKGPLSDGFSRKIQLDNTSR